jgi:hypothetical protein
MFNGPTILLFVFLAAAFALWKTGYADRFFSFLGMNFGRGGAWLTSAAGAWVRLADHLPYRDFVEGDCVVETEDGWLWAGLYIEAIPTDGFGGKQWNALYAKLNRALTGLPDETWVQVIDDVSNDTRAGESVYERVEKSCDDPVLKVILRARREQLKREGKAGLVSTSRSFVFVGRRKKQLTQKVPAKALISPSAFVDLEYEDFVQLRDETLRARDFFSVAVRGAGGVAVPLTSEQIYALVYESLNEDRALIHPAPALGVPSPTGGPTFGTPVVKVNQQERRPRQAEQHAAQAAGEWLGVASELLSEFGDGDEELPSEAASNGAPAGADYEDEPRQTWITGAGYFADSPRERVCFEPVEVHRDFFVVGERLNQVVSLQQMPTLVSPGLCESLSRHPDMSFPYRSVTHFRVGDFYEWDDKFAKMYNRLQKNMERASRPDLDEELSADDVKNLRASMRRSQAKVGDFGMLIRYSAPDLKELYHRQATVLNAVRTMDGAEGTIEKHLPLPQFTSTLPCAPHGDGRTRTCLSRDAAALMPLTGGPRGPVREDRALMVFERVDGQLFYFHPKPSHFPSGMSIIVGGAGGGKTGLLNYIRTMLRASGYRLITIDLGGASYRVCQALGGTFIDVTDARRSFKFGLFDIRPRAREEYEPDALTPEGLPRDRLAEVQNLLEVLCTDPRNPQLSALSMREASFLHRKVSETYERMGSEVPRLDDFIDTLEIYALKDERELSEELAARLKIYASDGALGRFLNESPDAEEINTDSPYTVFELRHAIGQPRLMMVASLAVNAFVRRMLSLDRRLPKYIDVDEFHEVAKNPLICNMINTTMRTARKLNMIGYVASQSAGDFEYDKDNPAAAGIRDNAELFWLLKQNNVEKAAQVFNLKPGVARLVGQLDQHASDSWRDCVLLYPGGGCAHLRLRFGALDQRLLLGAAGTEMVELPEALTAAMGVSPQGRVPARLREALAADALGAELARASA